MTSANPRTTFSTVIDGCLIVHVHVHVKLPSRQDARPQVPWRLVLYKPSRDPKRSSGSQPFHTDRLHRGTQIGQELEREIQYRTWSPRTWFSLTVFLSSQGKVAPRGGESLRTIKPKTHGNSRFKRIFIFVISTASTSIATPGSERQMVRRSREESLTDTLGLTEHRVICILTLSVAKWKVTALAQSNSVVRYRPG